MHQGRVMYFENYKIEPTKRTPWVVLEPGRIFIMGRSIPDNPAEFFGPVLTRVSVYAHTFSGKTRIDLGFDFINTSSTKWIYLLLKELSEIHDISSRISINWYFETGDEDMSELGYILRSLVSCPFVITEVKDMGHETYTEVFTGKGQTR